ENFGGYLTSEAYNPAFGFGIMGRFLNRAIDLHIIRKDNFPNLLNFTQDLSKATAKFTKVLDCSGIRNKSETFPQWAWHMLFGEDSRGNAGPRTLCSWVPALAIARP